MLDFTTIRRIWSNVEATDTETILQLSDKELVDKLQQQIQNKFLLNPEDTDTLRNYLMERIPLIRDLAYSRLSSAF